MGFDFVVLSVNVKPQYPFSGCEHFIFGDGPCVASTRFGSRTDTSFDYDLWRRLSPPIKKWDAFRYMLMYTYGGVYADTDVVALKNAEPLWHPLAAVADG